MRDQNRALQVTVWSILGLVILWVGVSFLGTDADRGERGRLDELELPVIGEVGGFELTNQAGIRTTLDDLLGKVWIADIIFTHCAGPCPVMTGKMAELQSLLAAEDTVQLVSLTTDPVNDSPGVLAKYAERFKADGRRWKFLTGSKREIARLATEGLKLSAIEKSPGERLDENDLFIHSTIFVLVDRRGRLRGAFETTGEDVDWNQMKERIVRAVGVLLRE